MHALLPPLPGFGAGIRRAARMADTWFINPHNKIDTIAAQMEVYKRALDPLFGGRVAIVAPGGARAPIAIAAWV